MGDIRATSGNEKEARRQRLLGVANDFLRRWSFADITMDRIADTAGVAKGTLYLYFRTKEALFLALFEQHLMAWYAELETLATGGTGSVEPSFAAKVFTSTLTSRPTLIQLHGVLYSAGGRNIDLDAFVAFRRRHLPKMKHLAEALAKRIRGVTGAQALRFLVQLEAVVGGLAWAAFPPTPLEREYEAQGMTEFLLDFGEELTEIVTALLS
jgi:AcrR family transcriptional regulator